MHSSTELSFRKSSYSSTDRDCVEVADLPAGGAAVRDTQHREFGHLTFAEPSEWRAALAVIRRA
ncbi:DUF397 domain-containing protein (plasmid) [Nocardiopsis flavescens]|nr:DUF397 domain-containing protein [Nocardiopsis flavescens]